MGIRHTVCQTKTRYILHSTKKKQRNHNMNVLFKIPRGGIQIFTVNSLVNIRFHGMKAVNKQLAMSLNNALESNLDSISVVDKGQMHNEATDGRGGFRNKGLHSIKRRKLILDQNSVEVLCTDTDTLCTVYLESIQFSLSIHTCCPEEVWFQF